MRTATTTWRNDDGTVDTFRFVSADGDTWLEVGNPDEWNDARVTDLLDNGSVGSDGRRFLPMRVTTRYLQIQGEYDNRTIRFEEGR